MLIYPFTYRLWTQQVLRCSNDDGYESFQLECPTKDCDFIIRSKFLKGRYSAPRKVLFLPFFYLMFLEILGATYFVALLFFSFITLLVCTLWELVFDFMPNTIHRIFMEECWLSFYDTNEHEAIKSQMGKPGHRPRIE